MRLLAWAVRCLAAAAALAAAAGVPAHQQAAGTYVAEQREMASALELRPEGRFRWGLSYGALDMLAEGRWRQEADGAIVLDTEPAVRPPEVALLGSGREEAPALVVRVADARGNTPIYVDIEGQYETGAPGYAAVEDGAYRFEPAPGRRIAAIRVVIPWANFQSEPFAVPAGANLMRLSFAPNDLGRGDFRGERAVRDGDALILNVLGDPIRYRRRAEDQAQYDSVIADIVAEGAAPLGESGFVPVEVEGPLSVTVGAPIDTRLSASEHGDGLFAVAGAVDLSVRVGAALVDFGRIGSEDFVSLIVRASGPRREVERLDFAYQDRLLTLDETIERARALHGRLSGAGFTAHAPRPGWLEWPPFFVIAHSRDGEQAFLSGETGFFGSDWDSARHLLADPAIGAVTMHLFTLKAAGVHLVALAEHGPRRAERAGTPLDAAAGDGREWMLNMSIMVDPAISEEFREASAGE